MSSATNSDYSPVANALHWTTVLLVTAWTLGDVWRRIVRGISADTGLFTHICIGVTILLLAVVRIPWRIANPPPKIVPTEFGRWLVEWTDPVSRIMHYALYALLVLVPVVGIALQFTRKCTKFSPIFSSSWRCTNGSIGR